MKLKEYIERLSKLDPEATVVKRSSNFELNGAIVEVTGTPTECVGRREGRSFTDAFDGTPYSTEVFSISPPSKKEDEERIIIL